MFGFHFHRWTKWERYDVWGVYSFFGGLLEGQPEIIHMQRRRCETCGEFEEKAV